MWHCRKLAAGPHGAVMRLVRTREIKRLVGSGDRIAEFTLPAVIAAVGLTAWDPTIVRLTAPPILVATSMAALGLGVAIWAWSVILILQNVPRHKLIIGGPYAWVKHPLYTAVALLVLPFGGVLLNTWLGVLIGAVLYLASRLFSPAEEEALARTFDGEWDRYVRHVRLAWL
jgi:protein-S-isoprenylcysteine O-methyltransferase Ste14